MVPRWCDRLQDDAGRMGDTAEVSQWVQDAEARQTQGKEPQVLTAAVVLLTVFVVAGFTLIELFAIGAGRLERAVFRAISFCAGFIAYVLIAHINR